MTNRRLESAVMVKPEPSRAYRWTVLLALSLAVYGSYYAFDCIGPLAPLLSRQLHFSDSNIGLLQAVYSFPNIIMALIGGMIIDRIGTKKSVFLFGVICFVGLVVTALTPRLTVMATGRLIVGIGAESLAIATSAANARWFWGKELSLSYGVKTTIERFGSLSAQVSPTWAPAAYTYWQWPLLISVGFGTCCVIGALLYWVLESRAEQRYDLGSVEGSGTASFREALKFSRSFWLIVALCVTFYASIFPFQTFAQKFLIEARHATPKAASLFVGMLPFFSMVGIPLFGYLVDRVGKRSLFMMFGSLLLLPVYLMLAYTDIPVVVPIAMMGVAFALVPAVMWPAVAYVVDRSRLGIAYGVMDAIQQVGLAGFNVLIGWSNDHWAASVANPAGYRPGMWMFSAVGIFGILFALLLRRVETGPHARGLETITTHSASGPG
jgi:MFS family permease